MQALSIFGSEGKRLRSVVSIMVSLKAVVKLNHVFQYSCCRFRKIPCHRFTLRPYLSRSFLATDEREWAGSGDFLHRMPCSNSREPPSLSTTTSVASFAQRCRRMRRRARTGTVVVSDFRFVQVRRAGSSMPFFL